MAWEYRSASTAGNSSGGAVSPARPAGTVDGDVLVAVTYLESDTNSWTAPDGWTKVPIANIVRSGAFRGDVWVKVASNEPTSWTWTPASNNWRMITVTCWTGTTTGGSTLVDTHAGNNDSAFVESQTAPSVTTTAINDLLLFLYANYSGTNPTGLTGAATTLRATFGGLTVGSAVIAATGATGTTYPTGIGTEQFYAAHLALFEQSAGSATNPPDAPTATSATSVTQTGATATWTAAGTGGTPTHYLLDLATDSGFTSLVLNGTNVGNVTSYGLTDLTPNTPYWYRVRAVNADGTSTHSNAITFTTEAEPSGLVLQVEQVGADLRWFWTAASGAWTLGTATVVQQNTTVTNDLSPDGYTWAQGRPLIVDSYGCLIALAQKHNSSNQAMRFVWSNDDGATWTDDANLNQAFITRGALAYDPRADMLHVLYNAMDPSDGIIYRRYTIQRNGANQVTGLTRDTAINLQLDYATAGTVHYEHPALLWLDDTVYGTHGALLAVWGLRQSGAAANGGEVRASLRVLSQSSADNTAANWVAPTGTASTSTLTTAPQVAYSALYTATGSVLPWPSIGRKSSGAGAGDVYLCIGIEGSSPAWLYRRATWNGTTGRWDGGLSTTQAISNIVRAGSDTTGYSLKWQLGTEIREDVPGDRMVFGFGTYKDNTDRDTWSFVTISPTDTISSLVDVYAGGSQSNHVNRFITGDVAVDTVSGQIIAAYTDLPTKDVYVVVYAPDLTVAQGPLLVFDDAPFDIPTIWQEGTASRHNGRLLIIGRDFNAGATGNPPTYTPPYRGWFVSVPWSQT